ncbi:MAG: hypothetical protein OXH31_08075 [Gammaproteobacteria bacterium]|nr:hypothetical protein [Gammaproteobacteria bacterium]
MQQTTQNTNRRNGTIPSFLLGALVAAIFLGTIGIVYVFLPGLFNNTTEDTSTTYTEDGLVSNAFNSTSRGDTSSGSIDDIVSLGEFKSNFARSVALLTMLEHASESQVLELLDQSKSIASPDRRLSTQSDILRRLTILDPVKAMTHATEVAWNRRAPLVRAIFTEWVYKDFEAAIEHAKGLVESDQRVALETILKSREDWSEQETIDLAREFGQESVASDVLEQAYVARAIDDPEASWNAILNDSKTDDEQMESLRTILEYWVMRDGADIVSQIEESISHIDYSGSIFYNALVLLTEDTPQNTFEVARNLGENIRDEALVYVTGGWASVDPRATLHAVSTIDDGVLRNRLTNNIAGQWATLDPRELLENLTEFPENVHRSARGAALRRIAEESPQEATQLLLEAPNGIDDYGWSVVSSWAGHDAVGALDWVLSRPPEEQKHLLQGILYRVVQEDPQRALETALSVPITEYGQGLEERVIDLVAQNDVDQAIAMLQRVRDDANTKTFAAVNVARVLVRRNDPFRALELGLELPEPLQRTYFNNLWLQWVQWDIVGLFESLEEFPSEDLKSKAAHEILSYRVLDDYRPHRHFTAEQLQEMELYLLDDTD